MQSNSPLQKDNFSGFDYEFVDSILHLVITDLRFLREQIDNLKPELFGDELRIKLAEIALSFYSESGCAAKNLYINYLIEKCKKERLSDAKTKLLVDKARELYKTSVNEKYITSRLNQYFRFARIKLIRNQLDKAVDNDDIESAADILNKAKLETNNNGFKPVDYFATINQRIMRREVISAQQDGVHFLIPTLEKKGVYAHRGEVTLVIAPSKRGKSVFLTHVGKCAVVTGHHVLHVSLENPIAMVEDRYDSMWSGLEIEYLRDLANKLHMKINDVSEMVKGKLYIVWKMGKTYSPFDLRADIERMRVDGKKIDTVIIDYGELLKPTTRYSGESSARLTRDDIFVNLRNVATDLDIVIVTAQQTPMKKRTKFRIYMEDGQESSAPAQHSSLIMTLNQTADEQAVGEMRLYVDGYWHGQCGPQIGDVLLRQDIARMQFCLEEIPVDQGKEAQKKKMAASP